MGRLVTLLDYTFDGSVPGLAPSIDPGAWNTGTVAEVTGSLQYSVVTGGDNTDWSGGIVPQRGKLPYYNLPSDRSPYLNIYVETEIVSFARTTPNSHMNFMLWQDASNSAWIYCHGDGNIHGYYVNAGSWTYVAGLALALPRKVRMTWNPRAKTVAYDYWTGSAWATLAATQTLTNHNYSKVAWYLKSWENGTCTARWGHILITADTVDQRWPGTEPDAAEPVKASAEEIIRFNQTTQGLTGRGTRLPGAGLGDIEDPSFGTQAAPKAAAEEQVRIDRGSRALYSIGSGDPQAGPSFDQTLMSAEEAVRLAWSDKALISTNFTPRPEEARTIQPRAAAEEEVYQDTTEKGALDFSPYTTDGDGKTHLGAIGVNHVFLYDTTGEPWATPSPGNGHYCAGRDGKFYYNGNECGPALNGTSFGTLAGGYNVRTWMTDVEPSAVQSWVTTQMTMALISDDHVKFNSNTPLTTWDWSKYLTSRHRWVMVGDFDVEVRYENRSVSGGSDGNTPMLRLHIDENNWTYVRRHYTTNYDANTMVNGSWGAGASVNRNEASGRLRMVRTGQVMTCYYWNGTSWTLLWTSTSQAVNAKPGIIEVTAGGVGSLTITRLDVFGFVINSGTPTATVGWSREAAGSTRGSRADFPEKALIVSQSEGVDIIDYSTSKLWMRFSRGANNALHSASIEPRRTTMKNGMMLISYGTGGGTVCVDFTTDDIRVHATQGQTWTGAVLRSYNGIGWAPVGHSGREVTGAGIIASRNLAGGYSGDYNNWRIPSEAVRWCHVHEQGGYLYKIHATLAGIAIHRWQRWYNDGATPSNWWSPAWAFSTDVATDFWWCWVDPSDETLYYLGGEVIGAVSTLFSVPAATWKSVASGGSFSAAASKAVPSTRMFSSLARGNQAVTEIKVWPSGTVWKADDNGVWSCAWPSGSFTLQIGKLSVGAPYPFMPEDAIGVGAMQFCKDDSGTDDLAVVDFVLRGGRYQTYVINLSTVEVYARGKLRRARVCAGIGALVHGIVAG